jgi:hypothetical protein
VGVGLVSKGPGMIPTLYFDSTFSLQIWVFIWRAQQDSDLRPSLFVVILLHRQEETVGDRERQISAFISVLLT